MDESIKIAYTKNMNKINFNQTLSVAIDSNVNIKTILNAHAYLFDEKIECGSGKAVLTGRIGLKVLYVDTDGLSNTITDTQAISENIIDSAITTDSTINILNQTATANVVSIDGVLKVSCDISISPTIYFNLPLSSKCDGFENVVYKKSEVQTISISKFINTTFDYTTNFETRDSISKILCHDCYFNPTNTVARDGSIYIEGKLYSKLLYETQENEKTIKKELCDTFNIATEVPCENISTGCELELSFKIDKSKENITTDIEDDNSVITIQNNIKICGACFKDMCVELVDDLFCCDHELDLSMAEREFLHINKSEKFSDKIYGEITLTDTETAIDDIVANLNIVPEITNTYIKNNSLVIEGIISSHLAYIDENKDCMHKQTELPFVLNTKIEVNSVENIHVNISIEDCRVKSKRGTIVEFEYLVEIVLHSYIKEKKTIIDNISLGKSVDFSGYDYQIFLAKPNESMWDLCKRIKISPEKLVETNKNLPLVMNGGEKIVIKR